MSATDTKIERLTEAIESLTLATAVSVMDKDRPAKNFERVKDAREEMKIALTDFLKPVLRIAAGAVALATVLPAHLDSRPLYPGAWDRVAEATSDFLSSQKRPNMRPWTGDWHHDSCCGPADAYETDLLDTQDGELWAIITEGDAGPDLTQPYCLNDDDDDHDCKTRIPPGTRILIPPDRIVAPDPAHPNMTGHGWVWLSGRTVLCYVYPSLL